MRQIGRLLLVTVVAAMIVSCSSTKRATSSTTGTHSFLPSTQGSYFGYPADRTVPHAADLTEPELLLLSEAYSWMGTPYLYGGNDRNGVDCSGFVLAVYRDALNIQLPRTSLLQSQYCRRLDREDLEPGDLVFFCTDSTRDGVISHVGIYVGDGMMIHSSSARGVIVSPLDNTYYRRTYKNGGRVEKFARIIADNKHSRNSKNQQSKQKHETVTASAPAQLPEPTPAVTPAPMPAPATNQTLTPARAASSASSTSTSAADARASFLNSLNEESADSLFSTRQR